MVPTYGYRYFLARRKKNVVYFSVRWSKRYGTGAYVDAELCIGTGISYFILKRFGFYCYSGLLTQFTWFFPDHTRLQTYVNVNEYLSVSNNGF